MKVIFTRKGESILVDDEDYDALTSMYGMSVADTQRAAYTTQMIVSAGTSSQCIVRWWVLASMTQW